MIKKLFSRLVLRLKNYENICLAALALVIVVSGAFWVRQYTFGKTGEPSAGGTYTECLSTSQDDWSVLATELTKTGMFRIDDAGNLVNQLVSAWSVSDDKMLYTFTFNSGVSIDDISQTVTQNATLLGPIAVDEITDNQATFQLTVANPNLPLLLTRPIFDYGPYKLVKSNDTSSVFSRSTKAGAVSAYINKIVLEKYDSGKGAEAVKKQKVDGAVIDTLNDTCKGFNKVTLNYPRYYFLLLNTNTSPFKTKAIRDKVLKGGDLHGVSFTLTVPDDTAELSYADTLMADFAARGAAVTIDKKSVADIKNTVSPSRQFQAIVTGLNYGAELDPYYFWSSSQILSTGNNLSGIKSGKIDGLITQLEQTLNIATRYQLIDQIHQAALDESAGKLLGQESQTHYIANDIYYKAPWLPLNINDRFQNITQWAVK